MTTTLDPTALIPIAILVAVLAAAPLWTGIIDQTSARIRGFRGGSSRRPYGELVGLLRRGAGAQSSTWLASLALAAGAAATLQLPALVVPIAAGLSAGAISAIAPFVALLMLARGLLAMTAMRDAPARRGTILARELLLIVTVEPTLLIALITAALATADGVHPPLANAALGLGAIAFALAAWTSTGSRPLWDPATALAVARPSSGLLDGVVDARRFPLEVALHLRRLTLWLVWVLVFLPSGSSPQALALAGAVLLAKLVGVALAIALVESSVVANGLMRVREAPAVALVLAAAGLGLAMFGRSLP